MRSKPSDALIWLDMEMTGLYPDTDKILEIAMIITDKDLNVIAQSPVIAIHQSDETLAAMDAWCTKTHGQSGLTERVRRSTVTESEAEAIYLAFLAEYVPSGTSPMCGNSIGQDRRFMVKYMPKLEAFFHYRNLDVSTLKELCKRWHPSLLKGIVKHGKHEALADIEESIEELKYYRTHFLQLPTVAQD
jgi:oligoribonuclease